jgi:copine 5/8/9
MDATISSIVRASELPLSILIVGVGAANFEPMEVLDGDDVRLQNATGVAKRDIVQFVPMRDFMMSNGAIDRQALSRALLDEIPRQLLSYMESRGIGPAAPPSAPTL